MTQDAKIRISAEAAQALAALRQLRQSFKETGNDAKTALDGLEDKAAQENVKALEKEVKALGKELDTTGDKADHAFDGLEDKEAIKVVKELAKQIRDIGKDVEKTKDSASSLDGALQFGVSLVAIREIIQLVKGLSTAILDARIQSERMTSGALFAADGRMTKAMQELGYVKRVTNELGLELASTAEQYFKLSAASKGTSLEGEPTRRIFEGIAKAATVLNLRAEETAGALNAIQQMISKGTVSAEELRGQLGERLPGAFQIAARAMGVTTEELGKMLEQGEIAATDMLPKLAKQLEVEFGGAAERSSQQTQQAINRVTNAWNDLKKAFADSGPADALRGILDRVAEGFGVVADGIRRAKAEGKGFWGQMLGGAQGGQSSKNFSQLLDRQKELKDQLALLSKFPSSKMTPTGIIAASLQEEAIQVDVELARRRRAAADADALDANGQPDPAKENADKEKQGKAKNALKELVASAMTSQQKLALERKKFMDQYKGILSNEDLAKAEEAFAAREIKAAGTRHATRAAIARKGYDDELDLRLDALKRQAALNEQERSDGVTGFTAYFAKRRELLTQSTQTEVEQLQMRLQAERDALAVNVKSGASADAVARGQEAISRIQADITKKKRDQADAVAQIKRDEADVLRDLKEQANQIDRMLRSATGTDTAETVGADVRKRYEGQLQSVLANEQDPEPLLKLIDVEVERAKFQFLLQEFQNTKDQLAQKEATINTDVDLGLRTQADAEREILDLRRQSTEQLQQQADALAEQAANLNNVAGKPQQKETNEAVDANQDVKVITKTTTEFEKFAKSSAVSGFKGFISDIVSGSKTAGEALTDMVSGFASSMLDVLAQNLADQLIGQFSDAVGGGAGGAGGGGWMSAIGTAFASLFHTGGVVGEGPSGQTRAVPASTWRTAPRYHTGGIAGLMPNEKPAILQVGEEVLRRDDPRHVANGGRSYGGISVTNEVSITGGAGNNQEQERTANDLLGVINTAIESWAARNSRPGGVLSRG